MEREEILKVYKAGPDEVVKLVQGLYAVIEKQQKQIEELTTTVNKLQARVEELESRIKKDSHNSNKPPSSDGVRKRKESRSRRKSGRKQGGQNGHEGNQLKMTETPDTIVVHRLHRCRSCHGSLKDTAVKGHERRQVFDIPPVKLEVTEHRVETKVCPHCGKVSKADYPDDVRRPAQYGSRIKGFTVYLNQYQLIPYERLVELLKDLFGVNISAGTVYNFNKQGYEILEPVEQTIKDQLRESPLLHADETGVSCGNSLQWLHVLATSHLTYYLVHAKRGKEATDAMGILPEYNGIVLHDFWKPYFRYGAGHALCNAHIIRELTFILEEYRQKWAGDMITHLLGIKSRIDRCTRGLQEKTLRTFEIEYDRIIGKGMRKNPRMQGKSHVRGRVKQTKARNLLERMRDYKSAVLAFMYDGSVPFDNNQAERDLRMAKVQQKISGCFRSESGAAFFSRIRGYISTTRKNGMNVFDALQGMFAGYLFIPKFAE
jgi:transposase